MEVERSESEAERYDRNWIELVQELRVAQTGVQVLAGFLLTLPFTAQFADISSWHRSIYLVAFSLAVATVGLMTAPAALHRFLFGHHEKDTLVRAGGWYAKAGLTTMGLTLVTVVVLIFGVVVGDVAGLVAGAVVLALYLLAWVVLPLSLLRRG
ncbi:hypothetical protein SAMN04488570_2983 [Nocardioides scoriae]|uniref:Sodium:proton antiporter n=1 Tax=Nocardioides scoriae TaxID=642780 RepID=A0A1H1VYN7_9ACTN|nr:DUF6328 family protein [Nocardioides scoriae]SDS89954.1 hypothetical protein SAMN04488570_2983 [Nocardioides scoriae]